MPRPRTVTPARGAALLGVGVGIASFLYLLLALPPVLGVADESYTLYGAKRILQGQALYRDFFDFIAPGSFYVYALAFAVGGVSIVTARVTSAALDAVAAAATYFLARHVASAGEAAVAGILVAVVCVPVWNFASHHWIATSMALASAATVLSSRFAGSTRLRPAAAGALAGILLCSHQGRGFAFLPWLGVTVAATAAAAGGVRRCARELAWTLGGGAAVCVPVLGWTLWRASFAAMVYDGYTWVLTNYRPANVGRVGWGSYGATWTDGVDVTYLWLFRALPAILALEAAMLLVAMRRDGVVPHLRRAALLLLAVLSVAAVLYYPDVIHVAFVAPFSLAVMAGMVHRLHAALAVPRAVRGLALACVVALVAAKASRNASILWSRNPVRYETAFGTLAGSATMADLLRDLRGQLDVRDGVPARLFAYQADAWLYLVLPADDPTAFSQLRPNYNSLAQIRQAIDDLERDPGARVVVNLLGRSPGDPFLDYLDRHYHEVAAFGPKFRDGTSVYRLYEHDRRG